MRLPEQMCLPTCALAFALLTPQLASAQALEPDAERALQEQEERGLAAVESEQAAFEQDPRTFGPGSIDLLLGAGIDLGGFFYPHIEPGVDIGLIPLGDGVTLSLGASLDVGYCVFCGLLSLVTSATGHDVSVQSYYLAPTARAVAHLNLLSKALDVPELDVSAGLMVSPSYYNFELELGQSRAVEQTLMMAVGPVFSARFMLDSGLLVFVEYRYLASFGDSKIEVRTDDGDRYVFDTGDGGRYGQSYTVGIGYRL